MVRKLSAVLLLSTLMLVVVKVVKTEQPYFIEKCYREDPNVDECLKYSGNKLIKYLREGIPELNFSGDVEPVVLDEISIALGNGPDGYRATFNNIAAYGVSNLTVSNVRSDIETLQFQLTFEIPRIRTRAKYRSTGVLILIETSGSGDYWGDYEGVKAKVYIKAVPYERDGTVYLTVESAKMDFSVKSIQMGVENIAKSNSIILAAMNLFINSNAQELLKEMKPQLREKLTVHLRDFIEDLFSKVPYDYWIE